MSAAVVIRRDRKCSALRGLPLTLYTQLAYDCFMKATFTELPPFERHRQNYLDDESFRAFQKMLMEAPEAGVVIEGTGGLRKIRYADAKRGKGKRGGLRVIYYWWQPGKQFWLFTVYNKDEMDDLTAAQRKTLKELLKQELDARRIK